MPGSRQSTWGRLTMLRIVLITVTLVACLQQLRTIAAGVELSPIPKTRRIEGRVTLEYVEGEKRVTNKLAFTELADPDTGRSKVTIGHVSWDPKVYYTRGRNVMTIDNLSKRCLKLPESNRFLPELDFFMKYSYTDQEIDEGLSQLRADCHSPIGILLMHIAKGNQFDHSETHRGVVCSVYRSRYQRSKTDTPIKFDIFVPKVTSDKNNRLPLFTVREIVEDLKKSEGFNTFSTTITIDLFYVEQIDKKDPHQLARLEEELTLPLGAGCSEFIPEADLLGPPDYKSFMMSFVRGSSQDLVSLAYDHEFNYLRKEQHGSSVSIWDLNEDLLYHSDKSMAGRLYVNSPDSESNTVYSSPCSVLKFEDDFGIQTSSSTGKLETYATTYIARPYNGPGESVNVFEFLGFQVVHYMGQATVRDLPAMVFEAIADKPPRVFQLEFQNFAPNIAKETVQFIVQFYVFKTSIDYAKDNDGFQTNELPAVRDHYWPARINLYVRHKESGYVHLHESLEVQDFHWGLYGWQGKPSELFMMPDCFDDEDEQLRIELSLNMKQTTPTKRQEIYTNYKYKLELDLQSDLFKRFQMSRLHLTDYSVSLLRHNLLARLVISDRREASKLSYFGEGQLPSEDAYKSHKVILKTGTAVAGLDGCLMTASHIESISMAMFCPASGNDATPTCTVIFDESEPVIKKLPPAGSTGLSPTDKTRCQVFRFEQGNTPKRATQDPDQVKRKLYDYEFHFALGDVTDPQTQAISKAGSNSKPVEIIEMGLDDFDVSCEQQLLSLNNYKFAEPKYQSETSLVRSFNSMTHDTIGDCLRLCNLDSSCRSYSYCAPSAKVENEARCLLSSLDLRLSKVESQLVEAKPTPDGNQISVRGQSLPAKVNSTSKSGEYRLDLQSGCNIHERDFLSMFTRTEEFLRIDRSQAVKFSMASSPTECARRVVEREDQDSSHLGAIFAYCAGTGTCLSDEDLFGSVKNGRASSVGEEDELIIPSQELSCQVFRKRYQTYFDVSPMVVKRATSEVATNDADQQMEPVEVSGGLRQIQLTHNTVEECARTCWNSYGHVCVSFDYCAPQTCLINSIGGVSRYEAASVELESRSSCLGYKRDLKWDQMRRDHLLGSHNQLQLETFDGKEKAWKMSSFFSSLLTLGLIVVFFDVGLILGKKFSDRLDANGDHRSRSGPGTSSKRTLTRSILNLGRSSASDSDGNGSIDQQDARSSVLSRFNFENEIYESANSIQMADFGQRNESNSTSSTNGGQPETASTKYETPTEPNLMDLEEMSRPAPRQANFIDVPNLL